MGRKRIDEKPLTGAEKQRRYREKRRAELEALKAAQVPADQAAMRETIKAELRESWEPEVKQARIKEQRKQVREAAKQADYNFNKGRYFGIMQAAAYFIGINRPDITRVVLEIHGIDRQFADNTLQGVKEEDKRIHSVTLAMFDRAKAWDPPPKVIK